MIIKFSDLSSLCSGKELQRFQDSVVQYPIIDSRKVLIDLGSVFFAVSGIRHDGHNYIEELYQKGVRQFVVEKEIDLQMLPEANVLKVENSILALQKIATHHRENFDFTVVGISGSNGKTMVKEWLAQILSKDKAVVKSPGSYNSQVGVPLSVWQIRGFHQIGIFEAGVSRKGEMKSLQKIIQPTVGIFTNIGSAHDEGFKNQFEKIEEKLELFLDCERLIYCKDHLEIDRLVTKIGIPSLSWGESQHADIQIVKLGLKCFQIKYRSAVFNLDLPFVEKALQENIFHVVSFLLMENYAVNTIQERLSDLSPVSMRLQLKEGINNCLLIDDSYNNDLVGLQISLDFLRQQKKVKKAIILSDILQTGMTENKLIEKIKNLLDSVPIKKIVGIGPVLFKKRNEFSDGLFYPTEKEFIENFNTNFFFDEAILIKGARPFQFEKIVKKLERKAHGTILEVNLSGLVANLNYFKSLLLPETKIMAMVKAFAYGSGTEQISNFLQYHRVNYLGVAYTDEGVDLRKANINLPIMVMNPTEESFTALTEYMLEPEMYSLRLLSNYIQFLDGSPSKVHIKIDTGMHRLGFDESTFEEMLTLLEKNKNIVVASIFSHLVASNDAEHDEFTKDQIKVFESFCSRFEESFGYRPLRHILNTGGILRMSQYQFEMVRLGIGIYGISPLEGYRQSLANVATLKTVISQVKKIKSGDSIGYGRKDRAKTELTIATIAIGYADGYSRNFSGGVGKVMVNGKLASVVGNVCMDMTMIDVTDIEAKEGDEVIIFGEKLPLTTIANSINTIPYEILASIGQRVRRVFIAETI